MVGISLSFGTTSFKRRSNALKIVFLPFVAIALFALSPAPAHACSVDDNNFLEAFLDASCIQSQTNTTLDAQGGVRLTTNGSAGTTTWDTDTQFDSGVTFEAVPFAPVGVGTLTRNGTGTAATLDLQPSVFPLQANGTAALAPPASAVDDNDNVEDPSVVKVGATYVMYYAGNAENSGESKIFQATSVNGLSWTRANGGAAVLAGTVGAFDEYGVSDPEVIYNPLDLAAPYRMWYSGQDETFGAIGYATSTDGVSWTKHTGGGPSPVPVLDHGLPGAADSFSAADPSVMLDGTTWKMWYTGDDSSKKRIAYATSTNATTWGKGGSVIAPEDPGASANLEFGAFSPTVWKAPDGEYLMLLTGRKIVSGSTYQTKILNSSSSDGISWSGPSPSINPSGSSANFDYSNLDGPDVMQDPGSAAPYKAYYAGNTVDANGNFHMRIGYATSNNGNSFGKVTGSGTGGSVLDVNTAGTAFDSRAVSGPSVAAPSGAPVGKKFVGFYAGIRGSDFKWRIGGASAPDGTTWTRFVDGAETGGSLLPLGNSPANFDLGGQLDPSVLYDSSAGSPFRLYFTALTTGGVKTIGSAATSEDVDKQPVNTGWSTPSRILDVGSGFDGSGVSHPSVLKDGATYRLYYTGTSAGGVVSIGYTSSASATSFAGARTQILSAGSGVDGTGVKNPVVWKAGAADYRMVYTAVATENGEAVERLGYAVSTDGASWSKASPSVILNPSAVPFRYDEVGVDAAGALLDGATPMIWFSGKSRDSRSRGGFADASTDNTVYNGSATYQLGDATTSVRDYRQIARASSGDVELWMSFLQPYSSSGTPYWSDYFPVTQSANPETLNFLLTIRGVRWQVRMKDPSMNALSGPSLDSVTLTHAPVNFNSTGTVVTTAIAPPPGLAVANWNKAVVNTSLFQPSGGGSATATARVLNAVSGVQVASGALSTGGDTDINLSAVSVADHPQLRVAIDMASAGGQASPLVNSLQVTFNQTVAPAVTLAASAPSTVFGTAVTLSGTVTQGGAPLAGRAVEITGTPVGGAAAVVATAVTDAAGAYAVAVTPDRHTTYAAAHGGSSSGAVAVQVAERVLLKVRRKGTKGYVSGTVGPAHVRKIVVLQQRKGSRWVTIKKLKTSSKSAYAYTVTKLKPKGKYQFRASTAADAEHLAGKSAIAYVDAIKIGLTIKRSGRTLTFTGKASPSHPRKAIVIKVLKGTSWTTFAKLKLTSRSTFTHKKKVAAGVYKFRVDIGGDSDHWPGKSVVRTVTVP